MRMLLLGLAVLATALPGCSSPASAASLKANPLTLRAVLLVAKAGDEVVLSEGTYADLHLGPRSYAKPLVIDARKARFSGWMWKGVEGVTLRGGRGEGPLALRIDDGRRIRIVDHPTFVGQEDKSIPGAGYGLRFVRGGDIEVTDAAFAGFRAGITASQVDGLRISKSRFSRMSADGINMQSVANVQIVGNTFGDTLKSPGAHPDAIQFSKPKDREDESQWSSNILISRNQIIGPQQGVFGGFIRGATISDNIIDVAFPNAIGLYQVKGLVMNNNRVSTHDGAEHQARIVLRNVSEITRHGNRVASAFGKPGLDEKP